MDDTRLLLATDMDGTVIPLEETRERIDEIASFKSAVESTPDLILAYVTGRDFPLAVKAIGQHGLPSPEILVCDVGTSVYHATSSGYERDEEYARLMEEARGGMDVRDVRHEMMRVPELLLQPDDRHTESKLSYHLTPGADHARVLRSVREILDRLEARIQAVFSVGAPSGRGLLDLLPAGVAKDYAIHYLHDHTGVHPDQLIYAGDSGNDLAAMLTGFKVIVVGNATPGLKEELTERGGELGILHRLYFAESFYAAGVLEGCRHFGVL